MFSYLKKKKEVLQFNSFPCGTLNPGIVFLLRGYDFIFFHIDDKLSQHYILNSAFFPSLFCSVISANMSTNYSFIYGSVCIHFWVHLFRAFTFHCVLEFFASLISQYLIFSVLL